MARPWCEVHLRAFTPLGNEKRVRQRGVSLRSGMLAGVHEVWTWIYSLRHTVRQNYLCDVDMPRGLVIGAALVESEARVRAIEGRET